MSKKTPFPSVFLWTWIVVLAANACSAEQEELAEVDQETANALWTQLSQSIGDIEVFTSAKLITGVPAVGVKEAALPEANALAAVLMFRDQKSELTGKDDALIEQIRAIAKQNKLPGPYDGRNGTVYKAWQALTAEYQAKWGQTSPEIGKSISNGESLAIALRPYFTEAADATAPEDMTARISRAAKASAAAIDMDVETLAGKLSWQKCKECAIRNLPFIVIRAAEPKTIYVCLGYIDDPKAGRILVAYDVAMCESRKQRGEDMVHPIDQAIGGEIVAAIQMAGKGIIFFDDYLSEAGGKKPQFVKFLRIHGESVSAVVLHHWSRNTQALQQRLTQQMKTPESPAAKR